MKESIDCPKLVEQSKKVQKGQHWLVELLVFVTVYIIAAFGEMLILLPGELVLLNTNTAYQDAAASGDMEQLSEVSVQIAGSDAYAVLKLFSGIAMLLVVVLFCRKFQKRSFEMIGFVKEHALREYAIGLGLGVVFAVVTGGYRCGGGKCEAVYRNGAGDAGAVSPGISDPGDGGGAFVPQLPDGNDRAALFDDGGGAYQCGDRCASVRGGSRGGAACIFKRYAVRYFRGALSDPARKYMGNRSVSRGMEFCA